MEEYRKNGCQLGWLLDPKNKRAGVYRPGQRSLENKTTVKCRSGVQSKLDKSDSVNDSQPNSKP
ncbi:hypothetical protein GS597_10645 [Synechococcales cyanobacterium C]|uniref:Putative restriction endonuclease domain-containing protein n=1 Tax=Petrachloros mirabilis ULC683 TaxID=2781853 RepID=A0A8K1ZZH9_9CYAN|nr:Uma2 family endonuclease [Petrachloros mirabilis]NCJ06958.1 hypothetical protein [Petrachloros mirabilis ULC683]